MPHSSLLLCSLLLHHSATVLSVASLCVLTLHTCLCVLCLQCFTDNRLIFKVWPIFLISVLALRLFQVVLVWDLQFEVILLCRDTGQSGVQGLLLWLVRNWNKLPVGLRDLSVGSETFARRLKTHLFRKDFFWLGTHFWVCITFCRVRHNDRLFIIIIIIFYLVYVLQHCQFEFISYTKDLSVISNDLSSIFIMDNSPGAYKSYPSKHLLLSYCMF